MKGTVALVRLALRRDRVMIPVWLAVFISLAASSAAATASLYPTVGSRVLAAEAFNHSQALVALYGHIYDPTSLGEIAMLKASGTGAIFVAIFAIITMVRHTRAEEETGRLELVGSTVVGRLAPLTAALLIAIGASLVLAVLTGASLVAAGLPPAGSFAFGFSWAAIGIAFAGIAAFCAQLTRAARAATGSAIAVLGVVYVLRAVGDTASPGGPRWLTWLSPIGWSQQVRSFAENRWWVLLITLGFAIVMVAVTYLVATRRDLGAGLVPDRPGPAQGGRTLRSVMGLSWRLHRASLLAWAIGFVLLGLVFGGIASNVSGFLDSQQARDMFTKLGGAKGITDAFLAAELGFVATAAAAFGIQATMRLRSEENGQRAESLLATGTGRVRWASSHIAAAILGTAVLAVGTGLAAGVAHASQVHDASRVGALVGAAVAYLPAVWVLIAITVAGYGFRPRAAMAGWIALAAFVLLAQFGPLLELPQWVMDLSPFAHVPKLPGAEFSWLPLALLTAVAAGTTAVGLAALRRRDIPA
ncbi:MAG TPA: ABC transporter permease [Actinomycetota bacterium]|nr:ABC transporter permease [Actinomycetota bacterium]